MYNLKLIFVARGCVRCHERTAATRLFDFGGTYPLRRVDGSQLAPEQEVKLKQVVAQINDLRSAAGQAGRRLHLTLVGHTDKTGSEQFNARLSQERAEAVHSLLVREGLGLGAVDLVGVGPREPMRPNMSEQEETLNRRVTFRVRFDRLSPAAP